MRILGIFDGDYPWDVRMEKILRTLVSAGHEVSLLARNSNRRAQRELLDGVEIHRLPTARALERLASFPAFFNPRWLRAAAHTAGLVRPELVLVRDLPLAPLGLWLARRCGASAMVDMAEPYPEALRSNWQFDDLGGIDHLVRNPRLADLVERSVVRAAPHTLVVSEEAGARLERLGLPGERWTLVGNTPDVAGVRELARRAAPLPEGFGDRPVVVFTGILVGDRGVEVAIHGLSRGGSGPRAPALLVVGEGPARERFDREARAAGVSDRVAFLGWKPHDELPAYWSRADVGILPFHRCTHIDTTLANKLFDYLAVGLPILASDAPPMVRVLKETGAGETFRSGDEADFARQLDLLLSAPERTAEMSRRGLLASERDYDWSFDAERLLGAIERA